MKPIHLKVANQFVGQFHRHNKQVLNHKFSIGVFEGSELMGVAIVGRPIARRLDDGMTLEVLRTCTKPGAPKGTNSKLYGHCKKIVQVMGYKRLITYTLKSESGMSLKAVGAIPGAELKGSKGWSNNVRKRDFQEIYGKDKVRWELLPLS